MEFTQPAMPRGLRFGAAGIEVELGRLPKPVPAFLSALEIHPARPPQWVPLKSIHEDDSDPPDVQPAVVVFHLPRSGSTLLARMLAVPGSLAMVIEPEPLNRILSVSAGESPEETCGLRRLIERYVAATLPAHRRCGLKTSSWNVLYAQRLRHAFPSTPAWMIVRDPLEVAVQVLERWPGWMDVRARPLLAGDHARSWTDEEYCVRMIKRMCDAAAASGVAPVEYETLAMGRVDSLAERLGLDVDAGLRRRWTELVGIDSEDWSLQRSYRDDRDALRSRASDRLRELVEEIAAPAVDRLRSQGG